MKIYRCEICGNIVTKAVDGGGPLSCCGKAMVELKAGVTDAAQEKHVPQVEREGEVLKVQIGAVLHPMTPEHYIQMILVEQDSRVQYVSLTAADQPMAVFHIEADKPAVVYEYCNLHGLWKADIG